MGKMQANSLVGIYVYSHHCDTQNPILINSYSFAGVLLSLSVTTAAQCSCVVVFYLRLHHF